VHVACGHGLVLLWWHCSASSFVDGIMFAHNQSGKMPQVGGPVSDLPGVESDVYSFLVTIVIVIINGTAVTAI